MSDKRASGDGKIRPSTSVVKEAARKARGDCEVSASTSHTQFLKQDRHDKTYHRITTDEYFGLSESISGSSDTFQCVHGPEGKAYTQKGLLKRNLKKRLDKVPLETRWNQRCKITQGWDLAENLAFLVMDPTVGQQKDRLLVHLKDLVKLSTNGYRIDVLNSVCTIMDYLIETLKNNPDQQEVTLLLLQNMTKPVLLTTSTDIVKYYDGITNYMGFLGYLLMRLEDDSMFDLVSQALIWHLSAPDSIRGPEAASLRHTLVVAAPVLCHTIARMVAVATSHRFPTYLTLSFLLASNSVDNCMEMMKENIIENIFYRFNPYFPDMKLPDYAVNPDDPQDINVKLGDSSVNMSTTLSLLLILLQTTKKHISENPNYGLLLPCPDNYAQRCFMWAFRYECRARDHLHQRNTLTVIAMVLLHCFRERLDAFCALFMQDIMSLSVQTELPPRDDWTNKVNFNTAQQDVQFKKLLINLSVDMLKVFPLNKFMIETRYWLLGMMYLLDPGLSVLRARWTPALFAELRKTALQAMVCVVPRMKPELVKHYGLIRRILWYIEWYTVNPYELSILYWCVRLLQVTMYDRNSATRKTSLQDLFNTHGIIILAHLCYKLLEQKIPPVEKAQAIIGLCLRLLTSALEAHVRVTCCVYLQLQWPEVTVVLGKKMLDIVLFSLEQGYIISDRWLICLLNFIWEAIIWDDSYRPQFIAKDGIFKLLDLVTMVRAPAQCLALALICDAGRAGDAVGQLVSWRASPAASDANPSLVKRGDTIATLLAAVFRDDCRLIGVQLDYNGVLEELESPLMSSDARREIASPQFCGATSHPDECFAAAELAGSRMSKAFALLQMLSVDLEDKVSVADSAYNMYKNVLLSPEDETVLVLCSHYLTMKLNEVWIETKAQSPGYLADDEDVLEEFLHIGRGWSKVIKRQQEDVLKEDRKKATDSEYSLYEFLGRIRLNIALDALKEVRCVARSADRMRITYTLLQDVVYAYHRRSTTARNIGSPVIRTYALALGLDDQNITGQNVKVFSIYPKEKPKPLFEEIASS